MTKEIVVRPAADQLLDLLLQKHHDDICVPECKTGSTWINNFSVLDLWVMKKSWTNFRAFGYEIKVNRGDFLRDNKWQGYLKYCTDFYFVAPPGIVQPEELPQDIGLLVSSTNLKRLYTRRKAVNRKVDIPVSIFIYVLMWRANIIRENQGGGLKYWRRWMAEKDEKKELGYNVSRKIREITGKRIHSVEVENHRLQKENEKLNIVKSILDKLGVDSNRISSWNAEQRIREKIKEIETGIPEGLEGYLDGALKNIQKIMEVLT